MKKPQGFTIVEVTVAVLVLSIGILGSFSIFVSATRFFNSGHASVEATANAAEVLERARGAGCGSLTAGSVINGNSAYTWIIEEVNPDLQRVTVIVSSGAVRARTDTLSAIIAC